MQLRSYVVMQLPSYVATGLTLRIVAIRDDYHVATAYPNSRARRIFPNRER